MKKALFVTLSLGALVALVLCAWLFIQSSNAGKRIEDNINQFITEELIFLDFTPFVCDGFSEIVCKSQRISYNPLFAIIDNIDQQAKPIAQNIQITLSGGKKTAKIGLNANLIELSLPISCDVNFSIIDKDIHVQNGEELSMNVKLNQKAMRLLSTQLQCKGQNTDFLQKDDIAFDITHDNFANNNLQEILSLLKNPQIFKNIYFRLNHINIDLHSNNLKEHVAKMLFSSAQNSDIERTIFALNYMQNVLLDKLGKNPQGNAKDKEFAKSLAKALLIMRDIFEDKAHNANFSLQSQSDSTPFVPFDRYFLSFVMTQNYSLNASTQQDSPNTQSLESAPSRSVTTPKPKAQSNDE